MLQQNCFPQAVFKQLIHLSDIHIPSNLHLAKRQEYESVFQNVYQEINKRKQDSLIVITGDLIHSKLEVQNETHLMAREFLTFLGTMCPVVVILGNHDFLPSNRSRTTSLEVICDRLPNVVCLIHTGYYQIGNIHFGFSSLLDNQFVFARDIPFYPKYALFHGTIQDWFSFSCPYKTPAITDFDGYDGILLGHIHKQMIVNNAAYAGSLLQQNFGESIEDHGFLVWDIVTHTITPIPIYNPYVRLTMEFDQGKALDNRQLLQYQHRYLHIRMKCKNTSPEIYQKLRKYFLDYFPTLQSLQLSQPLNRLVEKQNWENEWDYIAKHATQPEAMKLLHHTFLAEQTKTEPLTWRMKRLEFQNILIYGSEGNTIEWQPGLYALTAPNTFGKTSLLLIPLLCLFGKTSRSDSPQNNHVIHDGSHFGYIEMEFEQELHTYRVRREFRLKASNKMTTHVQFWCDETELTSAHTQKDIEQVIGSFDTFVLLHVVSTRFSAPWLQMSPGEKLKHLLDLCDMDRYERCRKMCQNRFKTKKSSKPSKPKRSLKDILSDLETVSQPLESQKELEQRHHVLISNLNRPRLETHQIPKCAKQDLKKDRHAIQRFYDQLLFRYRCRDKEELIRFFACRGNRPTVKREDVLTQLHQISFDENGNNSYSYSFHLQLCHFLQTFEEQQIAKDNHDFQIMQQQEIQVEEQLHGYYLQELDDIKRCKEGLKWYQLKKEWESCQKEEKEEQTLYEEYIHIMEKLPLILLQSKMKGFISEVNRIFAAFTKYEFNLNFDRVQQNRIYFLIQHAKTGACMEPERLSGYESIVLLLALNYASLRLSPKPQCDMLWIDESFDCIDDHRFVTELPKLIETMKELYGTIVLISFRDIPSSIITFRLTIESKQHYSVLYS
jgi:DNA repair exonuclease SbcCD nuclease subunit